MKPLALGLLIALGAVQGAVHSAPPQGPAVGPPLSPPLTLTGVVVDARSNVPLHRARVIVTAGTRQIAQTVTDDQGRFVVENTPPNASVRAAKAGYAGETMAVAASSTGAELRIALTRGAAVMGRVVDEFGAPVTTAYITGRLIVPDADRLPAASRQFVTQPDRLGEFRLAGLRAGRYEISAVHVRPELRTPGNPIENQLFGAPSQLMAPAGAVTLTLTAGDEAGGLEFTMPGSRDPCPVGSSRRPPEGSTTATIAGRITDLSGVPLACAQVGLSGSGQLTEVAYTDQDGRYAIEGLRAGSFVVQARMSDHLALQYGQRHPSDAPVPIVLRDGEQRSRVDVALPRGSIISGTIVDEHGEPIEGIIVRAFQLRRLDGRLVASSPLASLTSRPTDDRGQYRLIGIEPGSYIVAATASGALARSGDGNRGFAAIYYPTTPDVATALQVPVDLGIDAPGVNIAFLPTPTAAVSGVVMTGAGRPFAGTVRLVPSARSGAIAVESWSVATGTNGTFTVRNVPPGEYVARATPSSSPAGNTGVFGMTYVSVRDVDPSPISIVVSDRAVIEGRVSVEGVPVADGLGILVSAYSADVDQSSNGSTVVSVGSSTVSGGMFRITGATGPTRLLVATPRCESCYVRAVSVGGVDATGRAFDAGLEGTVHRDVEIIVSQGGATIEGIARDGATPAAGFVALAFSTDPDLWYANSAHVKVAPSVADGSFRLVGLPPGEYFVVAVNRVNFLGGSYDTDLLQQISTRAERVRVTERARRTLELSLIRR